MGSAGFVEREQVRLLVWFEDEGAAIAGPATEDLSWVVRALHGMARQWPIQEPQNVPPMPIQEQPDEDWMDCTTKDVAIVVYKDFDVVVERGEVFQGSGLASYYLEVAGRRRHETEWVKQMLKNLALTIERQEGIGD
ncbi:MAG: hypothetical protein WCJ18_00275 [Planctomycetota bacterium]